MAGPVVHVTPELLVLYAGIPLGWKVNYKDYDFDIENETNSSIGIEIKVHTLNYPENVRSAMWVESGGCGVQELGPQQYVVCVIEPKGHLELDYNLFPKPENGPADSIEGSFTLTAG